MDAHFWYIKQAKISLAQEMNERQGYLDGEDQKTLISFILFGDPLDKPFTDWIGPKSIHRQIKMDEFETICERSMKTEEVHPIPDEVMVNVKQVVEKYLPGMMNAEVTFCHECSQNNGEDSNCQTNRKKKSKRISRRRLITLSKTVNKMNNNHPNYARITMNSEGKLVKLAVSR